MIFSVISLSLYTLAGFVLAACGAIVSPVEAWPVTRSSLSSTSTEYITSGLPRRNVTRAMGSLITSPLLGLLPAPVGASESTPSKLKIVEDPNTYSALYYEPPGRKDSSVAPPPLLVVLHGAGKNDEPILSDLGDPIGEHAGLIPSLIASGRAPYSLLNHFTVLAPYSYGKASFYDDSRSKLLSFIEWAKSKRGSEQDSLWFDPNRIFLFGFSDGATVAVELLTTRRFAAGIICSYGFTGILPKEAIERIRGIPMWVFHSQDDVIFNVRNSDQLVTALQVAAESDNSGSNSNLLRYNRYDQDPENLPLRVRGHSMGITASKLPDVYDWLLSLPPITAL